MPTQYKFSFTSTDFQEMLAELQQQARLQEIEAVYQSEGNEASWKLKKTFGTWSGNLINLREGLDLSWVEWDVREKLHLNLESQMEPFFGLSFCISGGLVTKFAGKTAEYLACANETSAVFLPNGARAVSEFAAGQKSTFLQIAIDPRFLEPLATTSSDSAQAALTQLTGQLSWESLRTTPAMKIALHQILNCPYYGLTKRFYLESKTLELIALQLAQLGEYQPDLSEASTLKSDDIARIYSARDILIRNLEDPPSLLTLAKQSRINSLKLKQGFRQLFGTTVFGYLQAYRMEEARRLLELGGLNVTQVAQRVGYAHPGKFSAAFKKKFGISPKALKRR